MNLLFLYPPAMLIFTWLFLREPCDYPWSRIRKGLFAFVLCLAQALLIVGFEHAAAFNVNVNARGTGQRYVADIRNALEEGKLSTREIVVGIGEKYFPASDPAEWQALKKTYIVRSVLVIIALLLMVGVLSAACQFKLKTLPFLLLFCGCAAANCVADFYHGESVSDLEWYHFIFERFRIMHQTVGQHILLKDRLALRLAWEDVYNARIWDSLETDDFLACDEKCDIFLIALLKSLKKYESQPTAPED